MAWELLLDDSHSLEAHRLLRQYFSEESHGCHLFIVVRLNNPEATLTDEPAAAIIYKQTSTTTTRLTPARFSYSSMERLASKSGGRTATSMIDLKPASSTASDFDPDSSSGCRFGDCRGGSTDESLKVRNYSDKQSSDSYSVQQKHEASFHIFLQGGF